MESKSGEGGGVGSWEGVQQRLMNSLIDLVLADACDALMNIGLILPQLEWRSDICCSLSPTIQARWLLFDVGRDGGGRQAGSWPRE